MMNVSKILGRRNILFLWVLGFSIVLVNSLSAQNVTILLKGKVIDEAGNALQGVQIQFKDGENSAGRTKSQNNGEFSFVLKPGKTYSAMFDRSDILQSDINMTVPQFTSYQELQKTFTVRVIKKGENLGEYHVFANDKADLIQSIFYEKISQILKKMRSLNISITVSNITKAKKAKPSKKKGKNIQSETQLSFGQQRIKVLIDKLISIGTSESRIQLIEGNVKAPNDIQVTVKDIDSSF
ncbi:hypothetical protein LBMAG36_18670 [Chlorobiota bacterium]|nr:hypothetical protein LBMAG36_18670 [Chlorobiota bacterium]